MTNVCAFQSPRGCPFVVAPGCRTEPSTVSIMGSHPWLIMGPRGVTWSFPRYTMMRSRGLPVGFHGTYWDNPQYTMSSRGSVPWVPVGVPWVPVGSHGTRWGFPGIPQEITQSRQSRQADSGPFGLHYYSFNGSSSASTPRAVPWTFVPCRERGVISRIRFIYDTRVVYIRYCCTGIYIITELKNRHVLEPYCAETNT